MFDPTKMICRFLVNFCLPMNYDYTKPDFLSTMLTNINDCINYFNMITLKGYVDKYLYQIILKVYTYC